jgi:peptide subunit release factor 1 (eRF1)
VLGIRPHVRPLLGALQPSPRLTAEILAESAGALTAIGLQACLAAVNASAMETLVVPYDGRVPGYECGRCGALGLAADCCPDWGTATVPVPDLIEEMVSRTLEDGGQVLVVHDAPGRIAARLHCPLAQ